MERYSRQLPIIGKEGQARLRRARVLIVGVGGLGSPIALYLAGAGVGTIGLVDDDTVNLSNLQRQVLYTEAEVDNPKVACAADRLKALNSEVNVHIYPTRLIADNASTLIANYDIVVDGCDNFATRYLISDICQRWGKPYIYGAIQSLEGQVAILCYGKDGKSYRDLYPDEDAMLSLPDADKSVIGTTPCIVGCIQANEVLKLISSYGEPLINKLWTIDLRTMQSHILSI